MYIPVSVTFRYRGETCRAVYRNIINCIQPHVVTQLLALIYDARIINIKFVTQYITVCITLYITLFIILCVTLLTTLYITLCVTLFITLCVTLFITLYITLCITLLFTLCIPHCNAVRSFLL
jgi:hypothetical protein